MSPVPLLTSTPFVLCFDPHEDGEGGGRSYFSLYQPSCTKTFCLSVFASKTCFWDTEGREDVPVCTCRDL